MSVSEERERICRLLERKADEIDLPTEELLEELKDQISEAAITCISRIAVEAAYRKAAQEIRRGAR